MIDVNNTDFCEEVAYNFLHIKLGFLLYLPMLENLACALNDMSFPCYK